MARFRLKPFIIFGHCFGFKQREGSIEDTELLMHQLLTKLKHMSRIYRNLEHTEVGITKMDHSNDCLRLELAAQDVRTAIKRLDFMVYRIRGGTKPGQVREERKQKVNKRRTNDI